MKESSDLRKAVKKLMIDLDMDLPGEKEVLADLVSSRLGRRIKTNTLSMALTGYRAQRQRIEILKAAHDILISKQ